MEIRSSEEPPTDALDTAATIRLYYRSTKELGMALSRAQLLVFGLGAAVLLGMQNIDIRARAQAPSNARRSTAANPITGEGLPNPAPNVTRNWGQLPAGRKWGTTAGIDIDPTDGNVWAS
jgi:hypothetical protein